MKPTHIFQKIMISMGLIDSPTIGRQRQAELAREEPVVPPQRRTVSGVIERFAPVLPLHNNLVNCYALLLEGSDKIILFYGEEVSSFVLVQISLLQPGDSVTVEVDEKGKGIFSTIRGTAWSGKNWAPYPSIEAEEKEKRKMEQLQNKTPHLRLVNGNPDRTVGVSVKTGRLALVESNEHARKA